LTISVTGEGATDPAVGVHSYLCGQTVSVKAIPDAAYSFVRWEGTAVEAGKIAPGATSAALSVVVDGSYTLIAVFTDEATLYEFPLDSDPAWLLNGQWRFGIPQGQGGQTHGCPDPTGGATGRNVLGVNLDGDYDARLGGPYSAVAGPFDLSAAKDVKVRFARWLNTDWPEYVQVGLDVSVDGRKSWRTIWSHADSRTEIKDSAWTVVEYELGAEADGQPEVYLKWWYAVVGERAYAYSGWNLDDIQLIGHLASRNAPLPNPQLVFTGTENYQANGQRWTSYNLSVSNRRAYPAELFAAAPQLPPCGLNTNASRTWVNIYKADGTYLYGFCALSQPDDLDGIWFAVPQGSAPPSAVYITLVDRQSGMTYTSNLVTLTGPTVSASSGS
jgi:hypothetical protein